MVDVAQLVSASDCGSEGRGFESPHPPHFFDVPAPRKRSVCIISPEGGHTGLSPSGKAPDFDSGIRRFKSCQPSQDDSVAQSAEHLPFKQGVRGSNPR